jgi:anthranilate synthase/aminodeoxychorismate synthase-like glutamine amidotransferase
MILVIDNYDSFTYNLVQYITLDEIEEIGPSKILISPGPGNPDDAGISKEVIRKFAGELPILGVCLGHQCIGEVYGAKIVRAENIMHGKVSEVHHDGKDIFKGIPSPFVAGRYHSLVVDSATITDPLEIIAKTEQEEVMGIKHKDLPV